MQFSNSDRIKILAIEDDVSMQIVINEFLGDTYEVKTFDDGIQAMAFLQNGNLPDIIITDLNIPKLNGLALISQIRASDFFKTIPIVVLSADETTTMRVKCLDEGADDFVVKPFNPSELDARLRVILRRIGKTIPSYADKNVNRN